MKKYSKPMVESSLNYLIFFFQGVRGITLVTFGTSVPDVLCSVAVMSRHPDMGVSQAIASNPLGVFIGLGLPWFLKCLITGTFCISQNQIFQDHQPFV